MNGGQVAIDVLAVQNSGLATKNAHAVRNIIHATNDAHVVQNNGLAIKNAHATNDALVTKRNHINLLALVHNFQAKSDAIVARKSKHATRDALVAVVTN